MDRGSSAVGKLSSHAAFQRSGIRERGLHIAERALALVFLILTAPLFAAVALVVRGSDKGPILYRGTRLGLRKRPFTMYKFRTLRNGANQVTGSDLLNHNHGDLTIPHGKFLRETRLDELPQLWNVLRGEMSFVGPRPERPEVYQDHCREIQDYEKRFEVRPGLIGLSQLFTPHGTHKRYRTLIDNARIRHGKRGLSTVTIVLYTGLVVLGKALRRSLEHFRRDFLCSRILRMYREKRHMRRVRPRGALAFLFLPGETGPRLGRIIDMNEQALLVACDEGIGDVVCADVRLEIPVGRNRFRRAHCEGYVSRRSSGERRRTLVLQYRPYTARSDYMIHQYFLRTSLASPPSTRRFSPFRGTPGSGPDRPALGAHPPHSVPLARTPRSDAPPVGARRLAGLSWGEREGAVFQHQVVSPSPPAQQHRGA